MEGKTNRLLALEGLRGVASIAVVFHHIFLAFFPVLMYGVGVQHMRFEDNIYGTPLAILFAGKFAVSVFFVLSGFVLSIGFFSTKDTMIIKKLATKRYLRLMFPALASIMLAWLLITIGLSHNSVAALITHSDWLAQMWNLSPNFFTAFIQGTVGIFTTGDNSYNPVLWTMVFEFAGSFIVFGTLLLFGGYKKRWLIYIALIIGTYNTWYLGFIFGMILADLYAQRKFPFQGGYGKLFGFFIIVGLVLGAYPSGNTGGTLYQTLSIPSLGGANQSLYTAIGALLVVTGVLAIPGLNRFFSSKRVSILGKYTFSLYLMHKLVLFTLCTGLFVWFQTFMSYNEAVPLAVAISLPVIAVAAILFEKYVDGPAIKVSGLFSNWLLELPQKEGTTAYSDHVPFAWFDSLKKLFRIKKSES